MVSGMFADPAAAECAGQSGKNNIILTIWRYRNLQVYNTRLTI